jgi:antitoxin component YwqK of YwqJK toxin-antitoxin module
MRNFMYIYTVINNMVQKVTLMYILYTEVNMNNLLKTFMVLFFIATAGSAFTQADNLEYRDGYYFKNGMLYTGTHTVHYDQGGIEMEMQVRNGLLNGFTKIYYLNGQQKEQRYYTEGKMDSLWINWNEQGVKLGEARYKMGAKHGGWVIWDDNGQKRYEMYYTDGRKTGMWRMWNENGELVSEKDFD